MGRPEVLNSGNPSTANDDHLMQPPPPPPPHEMQQQPDQSEGSTTPHHHQKHVQMQPETDPHYHQQQVPPPYPAPQIPQQNPHAYPPPANQQQQQQQQQQAVTYPPTNNNHPNSSPHHQSYPPPPHPSPHYQQSAKSPVLHPHQAGYIPPQPVQFPPAVEMTKNNHYPSHQQGYYENNPQMYPQNGHHPPHHQAINNNGGATTGIPMQHQSYQQQPAPYPNNGMTSSYGVMNRIGTEGWTTGLFDCMEDPTNAVITAVFPCLTFGQIAEVIDEGHTPCGTSGIIYGAVGFLTGCPCILSCGYRTKMRNKYDLVEAPAPDCFSHFFCEPCALCQEFRELRNRGLDPSLGWYGNQMRIKSTQQQPQVVTNPPMNQTMA